MSGDARPVLDRSVVLDVAYGRLEVSGRPGVRIGTLVESINDEHVMLNGSRRPVADAWATAFGDVVGPRPPAELTVSHPSTWGTRRIAVLMAAARAVTRTDEGGGDGARIVMAPRATLIARTHLEPSARVCVVAECHDGRLDVHRMVRDDDGWRVHGTEVLDPTPDVEVIADLVDDTVEAILVDGDNRDRVAAAIRLFEDATPTGRIAAVERVLLHRYGGAPPPVDAAPGPPDTGRRARPATRTLVMAGVATLVVIAAVVGGIVAVGGASDPDGDTAGAATSVRADVGRVSMVVPVDWRRTGDAADDTGAIPFTTFSARTDDRRILVVQNAVRVDSTPTTVATSLRNRLRQSGSDSVSEFSAVTRYADRDVISYRETPGSGAPIRWYVMVADALQVSVGCQPGARGTAIDTECAAAVGSVAIAPLR